MTLEDKIAEKKARIAELRAELARLEAEIADAPPTWQPKPSEFYATYHATSGMALGVIGAMVSLLFNIVGATIAGKHPLRLIQVYLTFPLGEKALAEDFNSGIALALGVCLYIATGMVLGIPFQMAMARFIPNAGLVKRLVFATVMGLVIWAINIYGILSWLQPMLFGGDWIADPSILPPWVAAATHVVFAWTMAVIYPWGVFEPFRRPSQQVAGQA